SRAMSTERTILSPFTKEYRVLVAKSGIRLFLEGRFFENGPHQFIVLKVFGFSLQQHIYLFESYTTKRRKGGVFGHTYQFATL
ncbi:hypothetical protein ES319_A05G372000v1, partial [Gossypium barbadense]